MLQAVVLKQQHAVNELLSVKPNNKRIKDHIQEICYIEGYSKHEGQNETVGKKWEER